MDITSMELSVKCALQNALFAPARWFLNAQVAKHHIILRTQHANVIYLC